MRVAFHTLGCKLNYSETSTIGRQFTDRGFSVVGFDQPSDVYVLNTCSVTERADRECRQLIRRALRTAPDAFVIVTGCYAQLQPGEIAAIDGVDLILGTHEKFRIFDHASEFKKRHLPQVFVSCIDEAADFLPASSAEFGSRTRAFLKVQDGCDFPCAFCTIPLARGSSRSQPLNEVLAAAHTIAGQGYKEIVLTGVNVGDYGKHADSSLLDLVRALDRVDGIERIRISSIEPNLLTTGLIDFVLSSEKFCNHFHIPLQSGSDRILGLMRRRYRAADYRRVVEYIKRHDPDAGIGADVISGFPGESDQLFEETCRFVADLPVTYLHAFTYSERDDTAALGLPDPVSPSVRFARTERMRELGSKIRRSFLDRFTGRTLPILVEGSVDGDAMSGLATNYIRVHVVASPRPVNTIQHVRITGTEPESCRGIWSPISSFNKHSIRNYSNQEVVFIHNP
ncbi:MAG TPA: tRNA (N(6)-L-threonylcarbamoyladenosine(37)-C(2))-methylthiotransferase MtaB [Bacteroidota bacterium]|nr:tRNA (N(6)-L-threonylcarbamoyladenosine(37)-C(2))-methylthiotransferase MtaB [Bacteroidota bacterium]